MIVVSIFLLYGSASKTLLHLFWVVVWRRFFGQLSTPCLICALLKRFIGEIPCSRNDRIILSTIGPLACGSRLFGWSGLIVMLSNMEEWPRLSRVWFVEFAWQSKKRVYIGLVTCVTLLVNSKFWDGLGCRKTLGYLNWIFRLFGSLRWCANT